MLTIPPSLHVHENGLVRCGTTLGFTPPRPTIHAEIQRTTVSAKTRTTDGHSRRRANKKLPRYLGEALLLKFSHSSLVPHFSAPSKVFALRQEPHCNGIQQRGGHPKYVQI